MALVEVSGHQLETGDRVKMNIKAISEGDMNGVEFTATGKNYWRYMCSHPDEVYTITALNLDYEHCPYVLSGYMSDNTWGAKDLVYVPKAESVFELIKNMTEEEMAKELLPLVFDLCESGVPGPEMIVHWLHSRPGTDEEKEYE